MSTTKPDNKPEPTRRYLMEIRGVLHVDAPNGDAARQAVRAWIEAAIANAAKEADVPDTAPVDDAVVRVGWLRLFPED